MTHHGVDVMASALLAIGNGVNACCLLILNCVAHSLIGQLRELCLAKFGANRKELAP